MKYEEWLQVYMSTYTLNIKKTTERNYNSKIRTYLIPLLGSLELSEITSSMLQEIYTKLYRERGKSAKTIHDLNGLIHRSLKFAVALNYIPSNPADNLVLPHLEQKAIHPLTYSQTKAFLEAIQFHRYELFYLIALFTGARESEILGITLDCLDLQNGTIILEKQLTYYGKGIWNFNSLKNNKTRIITIPPFLSEKISAEIARQKSANIKNERNLLFVKDDGDRLSLKSVLEDYKKIVKKIGRPTARFHDLRHTYATISLENGDNIKTVQYNLGHATASFTLQKYAHVSDKSRQESAQRMEDFYKSII